MTTLDHVCIGSLWINIVQLKHILWSKNIHDKSQGGRYSDILYIRRLGSFFGVQNFEFQLFFRSFRKMNNFLGMKIFCGYFFGVITKLDYN